jgi:hypothetical protein
MSPPWADAARPPLGLTLCPSLSSPRAGRARAPGRALPRKPRILAGNAALPVTIGARAKPPIKIISGKHPRLLSADTSERPAGRAPCRSLSLPQAGRVAGAPERAYSREQRILTSNTVLPVTTGGTGASPRSISNRGNNRIF